jgi:alkylation response protein AidB-like acyl-CoA dehydrogenase
VTVTALASPFLSEPHRLIGEAVAARLAAGERATLEASMAKCFASDAAVTRSANVVQIHGGSGYVRASRRSALTATPRSRRSTKGRTRSSR